IDATATGVLTIRSLMSRPKRSKASIIDSYTLKLLKEITLHRLYQLICHLLEVFTYHEPCPDMASPLFGINPDKVGGIMRLDWLDWVALYIIALAIVYM